MSFASNFIIISQKYPEKSMKSESPANAKKKKIQFSQEKHVTPEPVHLR